MTELWRKTWRQGFVPLLSDAQLASLRKAIVEDDPRLVQGRTFVAANGYDSPFLTEHLVGGACLVGWCGWQVDGLSKVSEVLDYFRRFCHRVINSMGRPSEDGCYKVNEFLRWFDETPREEMRRELLAEINLAQAERAASATNIETLLERALETATA